MKLAVLVCCAVLWAVDVHAADDATNEPTASDKETARELYQLGNQRFAAQNYRGALEAYEGADAIMRVPTTAYKLARTLAALGRLTEARDAALRAHRYHAAPDEPEAYRTARKDGERLAAELRDRIPSLTIKVGGVKDPATLYVSVDGAKLAWKAQHLPRRLDPGRHLVHASAPGYRSKEMRVTLAEGEHAKVTITLARVRDDAADGGGVTVHPLAWVGFGFAVVGIAVGSATGVVSLNAAAAAKDKCYPDDTCPRSAAEDLDRAALFAPISTASFIIGGVGLAVGVGALVWSFQTDDGKQAVQLFVAPSELRGRF